MFLKRLELHGFKSFARRTTIEFNGGVTAIVGPNGCGKSNLADALRWVLGEQSSRLLRARKVDEVIFNGSSQRSPLGMAEVTITLDNSQGWLPLDYGEVAISRRAYRSGESEYFINGQRVRLRQVADLLLRAKMGPSAYTIMGQGLVDAVLSLRPEERRAIVEEAADVRRHRLKLLEAQERLEAGGRDLERAQDILAELAPRLRQLERQVERAQEQAQLAEELAQWQRAWYRHRRRQAQAVLAAAQEAREQRQEAHHQLRAQPRQIEERLKELAGRRRFAEERWVERRRREDELRRQEQRLAQAIAVDSERLSLYTHQQEELMAEELQLEAQRQELATEMGQRQSHWQELDQRVQEHSALLATVTEQAREREERHRALQGQLAELRRRTLAQANRLAYRQSREEHLQARLQELAAEQEAAQGRMGQLERELEPLAVHLEGLTLGEDSLRMKLEELQAEGDELEARRQQAQAALEEAEAELRRVEQRGDRPRARLEALGELRQSGAGLESAVKTVIEAGRAPDAEGKEGPLRGVVGTVASLIQVPPGLERAIEAALEGYLQAVVVERWADALAAIELLRHAGAGRANFIVLEVLRPARPVQLLAERGVVGVAAKLIRCPPRYQGVVDFLLGRTIVTEDLAGAQRMVGRGLGQAVTVSGELVRPGGTLSGGSPSGAVHLMEWERELAQLSQQLEELTQRWEALRSQRSRAGEEFEATREALASLEAQRRPLRAQQEENRAQLARQRGEEERLRAELGWLRERQRRLDEESLTARRQLDELAHEKEQATAAEAAEQQALAAREEEERQAEEAARQSRAQMEEARVELRLRGGEREQSQTFWISQEAALSRLQTQIRQRQARSRQLEEEKDRLAAALATARREHSLVRSRLEAISQETTPRPGELAALADEEARLHEDSLHLSTELAAAEGLLAQALAEERRAIENRERLAAEMEAEGVSLPPEEEGAGEGAELSLEEESRLAATVRDRLQDTQARLRRLGPVNQEAIADYQAIKERHDFLLAQVSDLEGSRANLERAIAELQDELASQFRDAFQRINREFGRYCSLFFGGGSARLVMTDPDQPQDTGIEIMAHPPGKRLQSLAQLSGGERSLTASALLFALLEISPTPFCLLDEVDAALDDSNVQRFAEALRQLSQRTQFIVITHNRGTIEVADTIYGISMGADNISQVLSLRLGEAVSVS